MLGFGSSQIPTTSDAVKFRKAHEILTSKNTSQVVTLANGSQLSYSQVGDINGIPTIFFQGPTANRHLIALYDEMCTSLGIKLYCFDRPGRGASTPLRNPKDWSFASWGDYVMEATELLVIHKFYIVAHSFGCSYVLASWPQLKPKVMGGLRFLATWAPSNLPCMPTSYALQRSLPTKFLRALTSLSKSSTLSSLSYQVVPGQMGNIGNREKDCLNDPFQKEVLEKVGDEHLGDSYNAYELDWLLALETTKPLGYNHKNLDCSIKCWHGMEDSITPLGAAMWMQREMDHFLLFAVEGATHNIHLDFAIVKAVFVDIKADYINAQAALEKARQESERRDSATTEMTAVGDKVEENAAVEQKVTPATVPDELVENVW